MQETPEAPKTNSGGPVPPIRLQPATQPPGRPVQEARFMHRRRPSALSGLGRVLMAALAGLGLVALAIVAAGYYIASRPATSVAEAAPAILAEGNGAKGGPMTPEKAARTARAKIATYQPRGVHIVVDTAANRLYLKKGDKVVLEAVVSSGSGNVLRDPSGNRQWVFDTPRGEYSVNSKLTDPDWIKPDWAFIEEGQNAPKNWGDRVESGVLGDYALGFGKGYFIHGTLYTRLLGRNVTHGCIRASDKDLKEIFKYAELGTRIYIY